MSRAILDSSPIALPHPVASKEGGTTLKRSASVASLPTPPRTVTKRKRSRSSRSRSRSRGSSDDERDGSDTETLTTEGGRVLFGEGANKKQRTLFDELGGELGGDDAENPFYNAPFVGSSVEAREDGGPKTRTKATRYRVKVHAPVSPPPSRRQTQAYQVPKTPPRQSPRLIEKARSSLLRDSPNNPFIDNDSPESVNGELTSPRTPTPPQQGEPETMTFVFRGVRTVFANPHFNASPGVRERALLPIQHLDFSPEPACPPKLLFPEAHKGRKRPARARREGSPSRRARAHDPDSSDDEELEGNKVNPTKLLYPRDKADIARMAGASIAHRLKL